MFVKKRLPVLLALLAAPAAAATLEVGPGKTYPVPSAAAAVAQPGDRVVIAPGRYVDCAVWTADRLDIGGADMRRTVIGWTSCAGKGVFVTAGAGITVHDMTLAQAAVPDRNGAGIRAEGPDLVVERVTFDSDENGILAGADPASTLTVRDSRFTRDGVCAAACAHGIYAGAIARLRVERSSFAGIRQGHAVKSRAAATEIVDSTIADSGSGTSSYLVDVPNGGAVAITGNTLEKGPHSQNTGTAIAIGEEGATQPAGSILVAANRFANDTGGPTTFVRNRTPTPARLVGNTLAGTVTPLAGPGTVE